MKQIFIFLLFVQSSQLNGQSVGIGTTNPNTSSVLDIQSNNKGVLLPRMTTNQRKAIVNPEPGLMVYDLDKQTIMIFADNTWGQLVFKNSEITEASPKTIPGGEANDFFGFAVCLSGDYAVAGAYGDDVNGKANQGSAYVFHRVNGSWIQEAQLVASDGAANDQFGFSVSISGDYIVVGAPEDQIGLNVKQGSVYVFHRNGINWTQQHKFLSAGGAANDFFGFSVSINASQFIVGCPGDDIGAITDQGSATVYLLTGNVWAQEIVFTEVSGSAFDEFGKAVAINGIFAIVGIPGDDILGLGSGSAQLYTKLVAWTTIQKLIPSVLEEGNFGYTVALDGITAVVQQTINYAGLGGIYVTGRVFVYVRGTFGIWNEQTHIDDPFFANFNYFGQGLSLSGDQLVIGSSKLQAIGNDSAHVSIYKRTGTVWEEQTTLFNGYPSTNGNFGFAVYINGFNAIIGAPDKKNKKGEVNFINVE